MQPGVGSIMRDVDNGDKLLIVNNNNNLDGHGNHGHHGPAPAEMMFGMEDEGLTQISHAFQSAYQSIVGGQPQVST